MGNNAKELLNEFIKLPNDEQKWAWVYKNKNNGIAVNLDNDDTFITIRENDLYGQFNGYIGWSDGIFSLLDGLGIKAQSV